MADVGTLVGGVGVGGLTGGYILKHVLDMILANRKTDSNGNKKQPYITTKECEKNQQHCPMREEFIEHKTGVNSKLIELEKSVSNMNTKVETIATTVSKISIGIAVIDSKLKQ